MGRLGTGSRAFAESRSSAPAPKDQKVLRDMSPNREPPATNRSIGSTRSRPSRLHMNWRRRTAPRLCRTTIFGRQSSATKRAREPSPGATRTVRHPLLAKTMLRPRSQACGICAPTGRRGSRAEAGRSTVTPSGGEETSRWPQVAMRSCNSGSGSPSSMNTACTLVGSVRDLPSDRPTSMIGSSPSQRSLISPSNFESGFSTYSTREVAYA